MGEMTAVAVGRVESAEEHLQALLRNRLQESLNELGHILGRLEGDCVQSAKLLEEEQRSAQVLLGHMSSFHQVNLDIASSMESCDAQRAQLLEMHHQDAELPAGAADEAEGEVTPMS